jgi:CubicO group peptidase (beta-lactamase class C family)
MHRTSTLPSLVCIAIALASTVASGQQIQTASSALAPRVDRVFAAYDRTDSPGCAVGIGRDGQTLYTHGYGEANLEYDVPITASSIFESGSVAKQFTAAAIVLLAQDGKLSLDDDIRRYLPEVPDFGQTIRIRHLLTHTSGLRDQWELLGIEGRGPGTQVHSPATTLDLVTHQKALNFPPGTEYSYSNTGYSLLGIIVQRVSGESLDAFTQSRLFKPLGMTHTRWRDDFTAVVKGRTTAYSGTAERGFHTDMSFTNMIGNGGLLTTVGDLLLWNENFYKPVVGGQAFVDSMQTRMVLRSGRRITYALGLEVTSYDGVPEVSHSGATAGYRTFVARYPNQHLSLAVLCNLGSANPVALGHQVADLLLTKPSVAAQSGAATVSLTGTQVAHWAGSYVDLLTDRVFHLSARGATLLNDDAPNAVLRPVAPNVFQMSNNAVLTFAGQSPSRTLIVVRQDADTSRFREVAARTAPTADRLVEYAGTYTSEELDAQLVIAVKDSQLVLRRRPADEFMLHPMYDDDFSSPLGTLRFSRDASGRVTGFGVFSGRIRDVRFAKH